MSLSSRSVIMGSFGGALFGFGTGIIAGALIPLTRSYGFQPITVGVITASILVGALFGALVVGPLSDRVGRRRVIQFAGLIFVLGSLISIIPADNVLPTLVAGRFIVGLAVGFASAASPMYLSEVSTIRRRGVNVGLFQATVAASIVLAYVVGAIFQDWEHGWQIMLGLGVVVGLAQVALTARVAESPEYLVLAGLGDRAQATAYDLGTALNEAATQQTEASWRQLFTAPGRKFLILAACLAAAQILTGINVVLYYAPTVFIDAKITDTSGAFVAVILIGVVNLLGTTAALFIIGRVGRRVLLVIGGAGMAASLTGIAAIAIAGQIVALATLLVSLMVIFVLFFAISIGPIAWLMIAELFPGELRGKGMSISIAVNWTLNAALTLSVLAIISGIGLGPTFAIFAIWNVGLILLAWLALPETRKRDLAEVHRELGWRSDHSG